MLLFIISEIMVFGAFFTAYFFIRVVAEGHRWFPFDGFELPVAIAGMNTAILLSSSLTMHWAQTSIKNGNRFGLKAGMLLTSLLGATFLFIQINEYIHIGFTPQDNAQGTIFYGLTGLHGAHVFVGLTLLVMVTVRAFRGHFSPEHHHGVEVPGHLLALRRRHVGDRLHDDLHHLERRAVRPPWESEDAAFSFLLRVLRGVRRDRAGLDRAQGDPLARRACAARGSSRPPARRGSRRAPAAPVSVSASP